jgi:hypothetical protein
LLIIAVVAISALFSACLSEYPPPQTPLLRAKGRVVCAAYQMINHVAIALLLLGAVTIVFTGHLREGRRAINRLNRHGAGKITSGRARSPMAELS